VTAPANSATPRTLAQSPAPISTYVPLIRQELPDQLHLAAGVGGLLGGVRAPAQLRMVGYPREELAVDRAVQTAPLLRGRVA